MSVSAPGSADRPTESRLVRGYRLHSDAAVAIVDRATRRMPAWRLSNAMDAEFRIEAPDDALPGLFGSGRPDSTRTRAANSPARGSRTPCRMRR